MGDWTFFSNHGHVLVCLARDSEARLRDVAIQVGITERAVQKIVRDLDDAGYLEVSKQGRRNRYRINNRKALRHPLQSGCTVGQLLSLLARQQVGRAKAPVEKDTVPSEQVMPSHEAASSAPDEAVPEVPAADERAPEPKPSSQEKPAELPAKPDLEQGQLF